jgi:hypothetical protein
LDFSRFCSPTLTSYISCTSSAFDKISGTLQRRSSRRYWIIPQRHSGQILNLNPIFFCVKRLVMRRQLRRHRDRVPIAAQKLMQTQTESRSSALKSTPRPSASKIRYRRRLFFTSPPLLCSRHVKVKVDLVCFEFIIQSIFLAGILR